MQAEMRQRPFVHGSWSDDPAFYYLVGNTCTYTASQFFCQFISAVLSRPYPTCLLAIGAKLRRSDHLVNLNIFPAGGFGKVGHGDRLVVGCCQEGSVEGDVADVAARNFQTGQLRIVELA
jgi:hypothetical protein